MENPFEQIDRRLSAIEKVFQDLYQLIRLPATKSLGSNLPPILYKKHIQEMTGWPDGTFYAKVREMPPEVVIRGKSKRLLFDRDNFLAWLRTIKGV